MHVIDPDRVGFGEATFSGVKSVSIDRSATREVVAFGDGGPMAQFVDVVRQRVTVRMTREVAGDGVEDPRLGDAGELRFETSLGRTDGGRRQIRVNCVLVGASGTSDRSGTTRRLTFVGVSPDGREDPVTESLV